MKLERIALIQHLQRIMCGTRVTEAVFSSAFESAALTQDNLLLVLAPGLPNTRPVFKEATGLAELPKLVKALAILAGSANEATHVNVGLEKYRLVIDEKQRGVVRLMIAEPRTIGTHVEQLVVDKMVDIAPKADKKSGVQLTKQLIDGIRSTFQLLKATEVTLIVGPAGGKIQVGNINSDTAEFPSDQLKGKEPYTLLFGSPLIDVLGVIQDATHAMLYLGGPDGIIMIQDGDFRYILSPQQEPEDVAAPES